jgi:hypothetical protein
MRVPKLPSVAAIAVVARRRYRPMGRFARQSERKARKYPNTPGRRKRYPRIM